ncbi:hypothetical protein C8Q79DRAFT_293577 [Trametes meyenii]|nr:hypothetical protein C8Q79DRAFT_293577 [Trametes meyenii]
MAYIISVNAEIIQSTGGTCICSTKDGCASDPIYLTCVVDVKRDLITSTAAIAALSSFPMGLLANMPVGMAPGLGLNSYVSRHASSLSRVNTREESATAPYARDCGACRV